jgi:16S rRNA (uracil1498-N3)-methyltransferase
MYPATIESVERKRVTVRLGVFNPVSREATLPVTLGLSISRGERMDLAIQKSTELGVHRVVPLLSERTEVKLPGERADKKHRHWQHIALSACEQCGRNCPPEIAPIQTLADWLNSVGADLRLVLHHRSEASLAELPRPESVALLVGPEGGLSAQEIDAAERAGFQSIRLGPRVMRTETAPLAALSVLQFHWGDLR